MTTYDNHDRSKVLLQGEQLLKIENITHIPARVQHILSRTFTAEDALNELNTVPPTFIIDFHLINLVCAKFILPFHFNPLEFHPFIRFSQLSPDTLNRAHTGLFVRTHDIPSHLEHNLSLVISTGIRVCLITDHEGLTSQPLTPPLVIPPDSLIVHTTGTWSGDIRPSHKTRNLTNLHCHTWNFSPEEISRLTDLVHGRFMAAEKRSGHFTS
jgi:hypothetical protein